MKLFKRKSIDKKYWHTWFAWHPVETAEGMIVWMERVWRRRTGSTWTSQGWLHDYAYQIGRPIESQWFLKPQHLEGVYDEI